MNNMKAKMSLPKAVGIAGKDTLAIAMISKGASMLDQKNYIMPSVLIAVGVALLIVEKYLVD